jgi:hypothetical protein
LTLAYAIDNEGVRNGRLVAPGTSPTWYWPPTIFDLATGKSARIPLDYVSDFHHMSWTPDGKVMASARSKLPSPKVQKTQISLPNAKIPGEHETTTGF